MRTKKIEISERWRAPDAEKYKIWIKLYCSQAEIEKVREAIFTLEEGEKAV